MDLCNNNLSLIKSAVASEEKITSLTHNYYKYPARFSPNFVRAVIETFTKPEELVLDPYMGGGTTLIESNILGRNSIGCDINPLAVFVAKVKTTPLEHNEVEEVRKWFGNISSWLNLHNKVFPDSNSIFKNYPPNINDKQTWVIRKCIELALSRIDLLGGGFKLQDFARCVLLKTSQWALDGKRTIPKAWQFRKKLLENLDEMIQRNNAYSYHIGKQKVQYNFNSTCIKQDAQAINTLPIFKNMKPRLIVTSPPYPGVHILYHRWQVQGRRETSAPYWIINSLDGKPETHYTFGSRKQKNLTDYFTKAKNAFSSLAHISNKDTILVQLIAFSDNSWQLDTYLSAMEYSGFKELRFKSLANSDDGRLWRSVPNRKWYASKLSNSDSSKEVILFHQLR